MPCLPRPPHPHPPPCPPAPPQNITDDDVLALVGDEVHQPTAIWDLEALQVGRV